MSNQGNLLIAGNRIYIAENVLSNIWFCSVKINKLFTTKHCLLTNFQVNSVYLITVFENEKMNSTYQPYQ
jgi:hypothetical protein